MIKGFRFTNQLANAEVDARIHQEILNKNDGIFYGMELSYTNSSITISEGLCEISGRPIAVIDSETVLVGTDSLYCILVLEIDLSRESTKDTFNQVSFKLLTSSVSYPNVTQQDINKYNGTDTIYQLEFARFKSGSNGIIDFKDTRQFLNFDSIYEEIRQEIDSIEKTSAFVFKDDINIITAKQSRGTINISEGWTKIQLPLSETVQIGTKLVFEANRIIVGKGVSKVLISAGTPGISDKLIGDKSFAICINNKAIWNAYQSGRNADVFHSQNISNILAEVTEGDIIDISLASASIGDIEHLGFYLTVQTVE